MSFFGFGGNGSKPQTKMRCHYEVMGLEKSCSAEEIKKAYKKKALQWHPDRNFGNEAEAEERFKEVTSAYNVLSDAHERKWYDNHRESILRGTAGTKDSKKRTEFEDNLDLWQFFNTGCYSDFGDDSDGFYAVYSHVFENLLAYENNEEQQQVEPGGKKHGLIDYPPFGDSMSTDSDTVNFYNQWSNFVSVLSFSWEDEYNPAEADHRQVRREIEKHNKKARDAGRRKYVDLVRALVAFVRKRDPRIERIEEEHALRKQEELERRNKVKADVKARREAYRVALANGEIEEDPVEKQRREQEYSNAYLLADESSEDEGDEWAEVGGRVRRRRRRKGRGRGAKIEEATRIDSDSENEGLDEAVGALRVAAEQESEGEDEEEEEEEEEEFKCELCKKDFQSYAQLSQHLTSKAHRRAEKDKEKEDAKGGGKGRKKGGEKKVFVKRGAKSATEGQWDDDLH